MINFSHVHKLYDSYYAVHDLSLTINPNEIFGLIGANGAGKSTTLLMLAGLIKPSSGKIAINGIDIQLNPLEAKKQIGYMPDDVGFYRNLTAYENLQYFGRLLQIDPDILDERIITVLDLVKLKNNWKKVSEFSKGMIQRLGIANSLLNSPPVLLLDEPTANLDPVGVLEFREIIKDYVKTEKNIVIISSHIISEIERVCTTIGYLNSGKLLYCGKIEDLHNYYVNNTELLKIIIKCNKPIPEISNSEISVFLRSENRNEVYIELKSDIRELIVKTLIHEGCIPVEISIVNAMEQIFDHSIENWKGFSDV